MIQLPADIRPQGWKWGSNQPVMAARAVNGVIFTRRLMAHLWNLEVEFRPMTKSQFAPLITAIERLNGRDGVALLPLIPFTGAPGFVPGNFVKFSDHSKIYRLDAVPAGQNAAEVFAAPGLPAGFEVYPAPRSLAGIIAPADNFRASLTEDEVQEEFMPNGLIKLRVSLIERLDL